MKVYDVVTVYGTSSVVAKNMADAEKVFLEEYWPTTIKEMRLHSEQVIMGASFDPGEQALSDVLQDRIDRAVEYVDALNIGYHQWKTLKDILTGEAEHGDT